MRRRASSGRVHHPAHPCRCPAIDRSDLDDQHGAGGVMHDDPQRGGELTGAARALLARPWRTVEADRPLFLLIRRHGEQLDRWFTQRLGYRLVVGTNTAQLVKSGHIPADRPLRTPTQRPFTAREYTLLALVLAATAAGPDRISLRDLVLHVRSAAADAC